MLITGKKNIRMRDLAQVLGEAGGQEGFAILTRGANEILAAASTRDEIINYWQKLKCVIPAEDMRLCKYRRKEKTNHDKRRSTGKSKPRKGAH